MDHLRLTPSLSALLGTFFTVAHPSHAPWRRLGWTACASVALAVGSAAEAAPLLTCKVSYAGTTHTVQARPVADPYPVASVDIGGRFFFKPVIVGTDKRVEYIKLYTYLDASQQPVLVQLAKYLPPFPRSGSPASLTGDQTVYAGPVERELHYRCTLEGVSP